MNGTFDILIRDTVFTGEYLKGEHLGRPEYILKFRHPSFLLQTNTGYECQIESDAEDLTKIEYILITDIPVCTPEFITYKTNLLYGGPNEIMQKPYEPIRKKQKASF